ncbi:MAG: trypsin-like serine peptidase [Planctomycetota bacterium]|jgi:V8-like Glu-specific endopeptidase
MLHRTLARHALLSAAALTLFGALSTAATAQETNPMVPVGFAHDSGVAQNDGNVEEVVISFPVVVAGVDSMQLEFSEVQLAGSIAADTNSYLRITSLKDGYYQTMNARHVEQWQNKSAYFNGNEVLVEVLAMPGTGPNRVVIDSLLVGMSTGIQESQCGPTDDRVPSSDPRVCRLMPVACTAWMINDCGKCFLSAGHCGGGGGSSVQFNVPFSTSSGSLQFPPPSDQYAVDGASYQFQNGTDDWQYFGVFPNSTTGLTPFQTMGAAFALANPPSPSGNNIRITGHGTDSTPNPTYNQVQQTHVGPLVSVGTNVHYQTDTTGGSSGSPVIWEEQDVAVGVHTNGGCSSGSNNGTPITATALQAALNNPKGVCKLGDGFLDLGGEKKEGPFGRFPKLDACGELSPGGNVDIDLKVAIGPSAVGLNMSAILFIGFSELSAPFQGGVMVPNPDLSITFPVDTSVAQSVFINLDVIWPAGIVPGTQFYMQYWLPFDDGGSVSGSLASNAFELTAP